MCDLLTLHGFSGRNFVRGVICTLSLTFCFTFSLVYYYNTHSMKDTCIIHFEHRNDVANVVKLHREY